jgi:K+ transporter
MTKTKTLLLSNLAATLVYFFISAVIVAIDKSGYGIIAFLFLPIILVIFNLLAGVGVFVFGNKDLGKAFFLTGAVGLLIGSSFCGLMSF